MYYGTKMAIVIDVDTKHIYNQFMNYLKENPNAYDKFFCFSNEGLLKTKKQFSNILVRDASSFSKLATEHNLIVEKAMKLSLKNLEQPESIMFRDENLI